MSKGKKQGSSNTGSSPTSTHINRTRSKLATKRKKQQRQEATNSAPPPLDYEQLVVYMPRNSHPQRDSYGGGNRAGHRGRGGGGLGHSSRGRGRGFTLREEALNTNDNYVSRAWLEDKRSTLRHQKVAFIQSGTLSNKLPTPSASESDPESSHSNVPAVQEISVSKIQETVTTMRAKPSSHTSTARMEEITTESHNDNDIPAPATNSSISISRFQDSSSPSDSASISNRTTKHPSIPIPLPPVQFVPTEENIVFTPRNQRSQPHRPRPALSNWEVPADLKAMTQSAAPDWTKPRRRPNRQGGHRQFRGERDSEDVGIEFLSPMYGLPMTTTAEDALMDYLENIRAQGEIVEEEEKYIDSALAEEDGVSEQLEELSLEEKKRSRSVEMRKPVEERPLAKRWLKKKIALSESATPLRIGSPEVPGPVNSVVSHGSEVESDAPARGVSAVNKTGSREGEGTWILHPSSDGLESDSSDSDSNAFDAKLIKDQPDPIWNTDSKSKAKNVSSDEEDDEEEEEEDEEEEEGDEEEDDDDDILLAEDEDIIANMFLDDYDLDDLDFQTLHANLPTKKSHTRQPNVPPLPSADHDIAAHLQEVWKRDRDTKKQRKQDREKARLQNLLGKKALSKSKGKKERREARREEIGRTDELDGDPMEVDMRKINDEMRAFWDADDLTDFALPPMHRFARKIVHTLAHAYNLSSKSQGSGKSRYTVLFKTQTTSSMTLDERKIAGILKRTAWVGAGERSGMKWDVTSGAKGVKRHKDGDVVGGDAKEIASDNRGRLMLEKLGWRSGMGLGVEGEGMKLPVFAVVKASKSGLQ